MSPLVDPVATPCRNFSALCPSIVQGAEATVHSVRQDIGGVAASSPVQHVGSLEENSAEAAKPQPELQVASSLPAFADINSEPDSDEEMLLEALQSVDTAPSMGADGSDDDDRPLSGLVMPEAKQEVQTNPRRLP